MDKDTKINKFVSQNNNIISEVIYISKSTTPNIILGLNCNNCLLC